MIGKYLTIGALLVAAQIKVTLDDVRAWRRRRAEARVPRYILRILNSPTARARAEGRR